MNNNDKLNFNGQEIKIEDIFKKPTKEILIGLYIKTQKLDDRTEGMCDKVDDVIEKIGIQWAKIGKNSIAISRIGGILCVLIPIVLGIIGYIAYTR